MHAHVIWREQGMRHTNVETYADLDQATRRLRSLKRDAERDPGLFYEVERCGHRWCAELPDYMAVGHREILHT